MFLCWHESSSHIHFSSLPRIENALPGRDGYEVEIFGMEGIPVPDVADYKRRKEIELGLTAGSITQPPPKRPKTENRPLSEDELRAQLEAHKALMGAHETPAPAPADTNQSAVYAATPQTYATPAPPPSVPTPPVPMMPPGAPPAFPGMPPPPGAFPGAPPFPPPLPGMPGMPPGYVTSDLISFVTLCTHFALGLPRRASQCLPASLQV